MDVVKGEEEASSLPDYALELLLPRLPCVDLSRLACISKHWRTLLYSPGFWKDRLSSSPSCCLLMRSPYDNFQVYDPVARSWSPLNKVALPGVRNIWTSSAGLVCLFNPSPVAILNPLTSKSRVLPPHPQPLADWGEFSAIAFAPDPISHAFVVVIFGRSATQVYDSQVGSWGIRSSSSCHFRGMPCQALIGRSVHFLAFLEHEFSYQHPSALIILSYNIDGDTWIRAVVSFPRRAFDVDVEEVRKWCGLVASRGRLYLAAAVVGKVVPCIWEVEQHEDPESWEASLVTKMPPEMWFEFCDHHPYERGRWNAFFVADGDGDVITMEITQGNVDNVYMATCNLSTHAWEWMPPSPRKVCLSMVHYKCIPFQPRLDSLP